jgi:ElaB/YqjD/DUF883 family membrane-anchored ribosome-binding protein
MAETRKTETDQVAKLSEPLSAEVAALRADLAELGKVVSRIGKQRAAGLRAAAGTAASEGFARGEETLEDVLAQLQSLEEQVAEAARRRPFAALGLAALFGFFVGLVFRR